VYLAVLHRSGPAWQPALPAEQQTAWPEHAAFMNQLVDAGFVLLGGPLADDFRVVLAIETESEAEAHVVLAQDPWSGSHLVLVSLEPWLLTVDGRTRLS
jgi:uncharacterized protein YciI